MPSTDIVVDAIASSNLAPAEKKTAIRRLYESMTTRVVPKVAATTRESIQVLRSGGEAAFVGGALGFVDAEHGLDFKYKGYKVPADAILAGLGYAGSLAFSGDPTGISTDFRNVGADALSVLAYRKMKTWREQEKQPKGINRMSDTIPGTAPAPTNAHGEYDDPILRASREL